MEGSPRAPILGGVRHRRDSLVRSSRPPMGRSGRRPRGGRTPPPRSRSGEEIRRRPGGDPPAGTPWEPLREPAAARPRIVICRMKVVLPATTWLHALTVAHPECRLEVLDRLLLHERRMLTDVPLHGPGLPAIVAMLRNHPTVEQVELLDQAEGTGRIRVTHRVPEFLSIFRRLRILRTFPFWVANGTATWVVAGPRAKVRQLLDGLTAVMPEVHVEELRPWVPEAPTDRLTRRERELFRRARDEGYFDVPRRISLTALAGRLGLAKSTVSRALALAERKLLEETGAAGEAGRPDPPADETVRRPA